MNHIRQFVLGSVAALIVAWASAHDARAQMGQSAMSPSGGLVNQAVGRLGVLDGSNPGWLYYGINAADRGLGYNGSYMTLGGFFPLAEDDLGGFWAADLRGHLSEHGGFFSNAGAVRKQFLGGTLFGIGVYWDYDGDQNQYPTNGAAGTERYGQFGNAYNQVGVSAEWLTNYGNLRSNGYIPVGTTATAVGAPGYGFVGNNLLCQYGLDSALTGADLEVGAYIPGLADWAGMISVGGYALGNSRYDWQNGPQSGRDVVPWFGGVYTRLDMTFIKNWDFSLQANNDSYFDWTGFARLTYRMGGSRRRNVPDQMEQPMMRNEHIVRAHQTPIVAVNPENGQEWRVLHVSGTAAVGGNGSEVAPVRTLAEAQALATNEYDIVYVHTAASGTTPYDAAWQFQADNQILVGQGSTLAINSLTCGYKQFFASTSGTVYPVLASSGTALTLRDGAVVDHLRIQNAPVAIVSGSTFTGVANVNDVQIVTGSGQTAIQLTSVPSGQVNMFNMNVASSGLGLWINGGAADVTFQGRIATTNSTRESVLVQALTGGEININTTSATLDTAWARNTTLVATAPLAIVDTTSAAPAAIQVASNDSATVAIGQALITTATNDGVLVQNNTATQIGFRNIAVVNSAAVAFASLSNDAASSVGIEGRSSLSSASTTLPAFASNDAATLAIFLETVSSAVPLVAPPYAIDLQGVSTGVFEITDQFLVGGSAGTMANVDDGTSGAVDIRLP